VASQELGELGPSEGPAASFPWHWYYAAPSVGLWLLIVCLLVLLKRTRTARVWLGLLTVVLVIMLGELEGLSPLFLSLGAAWVIIWFFGGRRMPTEDLSTGGPIAGFDHSVG
jgi:hypothetical protein